MPCYEAGEFTLSADPGDAVRRFHGALSGPESPPAVPEGRLIGRHRGARVLRRDVARRVARAMAYGRSRAATRLLDGSYSPRPGWSHILAEGWRVVDAQPEALALVAELVDEQGWRADKRAAWSAILHHLMCAMDWETGLIAAVTAQRLGDVGDRAPRTVSRVIAWARDVGLLVVVEHGASAERFRVAVGTQMREVQRRVVLAAPARVSEPVYEPAGGGAYEGVEEPVYQRSFSGGVELSPVLVPSRRPVSRPSVQVPAVRVPAVRVPAVRVPAVRVPAVQPQPVPVGAPEPSWQDRAGRVAGQVGEGLVWTAVMVGGVVEWVLTGGGAGRFAP